MTLTPEEYIAHGGAKCPNCGGLEIEGVSDRDMDAGYMVNRVHCTTCGAVWDDVYRLVGYDSLELRRN